MGQGPQLNISTGATMVPVGMMAGFPTASSRNASPAAGNPSTSLISGTHFSANTTSARGRSPGPVMIPGAPFGAHARTGTPTLVGGKGVPSGGGMMGLAGGQSSIG